MNKRVLTCCMLCVCFFCPWHAFAAATLYTEEASFIEALTEAEENNWQLLHEGFEGNPWTNTRFPAQASEVSSHGLIWTSNHGGNSLTTGHGAARSGAWALFSNPHGDHRSTDPDAFIRDGLLIRSAMKIHAIGGWFSNNLARGEIGFVLDGSRTLTFKNEILGVKHGFYGIIDEQGFRAVEIHEREGTVGDWQFLFTDDLLIGMEAENR